MADKVSVTLVRRAQLHAMDNFRGMVAAPVDKQLVLTAENQCQLENMIDVAAVDGWQMPAKKAKGK